jgi:hypothetical protein
MSRPMGDEKFAGFERGDETGEEFGFEASWEQREKH